VPPFVGHERSVIQSSRRLNSCVAFVVGAQLGSVRSPSFSSRKKLSSQTPLRFSTLLFPFDPPRRHGIMRARLNSGPLISSDRRNSRAFRP
jgi:hypothetical protein